MNMSEKTEKKSDAPESIGVSVIIPVYNAENYLRNCLDSILAQTMDSFEVILINDGSTDSSGEIIAEYAAANPGRIRSLTVENGGQGRAKNFGIEMARGEFILNVDSDDRIAPDMLEKMVAAAEKNEADVVVCDFYRMIDGERIYESAMLTPNPMSAVGQCWNKLFRRSLIGDVRYPSGLWYEDSEFSGKLMLRSSKTVFVPEALYYYYIGHPSTMNNQRAEKNLDIIPVLDHIREYAEAEGLPIDFDFFILTHVVLEAIKRVNRQSAADKKQVIRRLREYAHKNLPDILSSETFRAEPRNRRIIMWLNYHGLEDVSEFLLKLK